MTKIPEWQYPLYKESDKKVYISFTKLAKSKRYPELIGSKKQIDLFLKQLILSQKMEAYRLFRDIVVAEFTRREVDIPKILGKAKTLKIERGIPSWAIFLQDKRISKLIDSFRNTAFEFQYKNKEEVIEFVIRFLLSQLLQDWRGPLMAVILECLRKPEVNISKLNNLLKFWDYTKVF